MDCTYDWTFIQFGAIRTGGYSTLYSTLTDLTQLVTEECLTATCAATVAVDMLRKYRRIVKFCPQFGGLYTQFLVISLCCYVGIAFGTIQATNCNHFFHLLSIGKNPDIICLYSSRVMGLGIFLLTSSTNWAQCSIIWSIVISCRKWPSA